MRTWHPESASVDESLEPSDPPEFSTNQLPDELRERIWEAGFADLQWILDAGVERLTWREPLRHVYPELVSDEAYSVSKELAPGSHPSPPRLHPRRLN